MSTTTRFGHVCLTANLGADSDRAGFGAFYYVKHLPLDVLKMDGEPARP